MNYTLLSCAALIAYLLSSPVLAQSNMASAIEQCRTEQNALKRLVCYDEIKTQAGLPNAAASTTRAAPPTAPAATASSSASDFGKEHKRDTSHNADVIYVVVKSVRFGPRKEIIIALDNGQVWRQSGSGTYPIAEGERHFIKRGMLGAFYLGNDSNNRTLKISRED